MTNPVRSLLAAATLVPVAAGAQGIDPDKVFMPAFDALAAGVEFQDGMDFDHSAVDLDATRYSLASFLSRPIALGGDWSFLPAVQYNVTSLDFGGYSPWFPGGDEDLHHIGLNAIFYHMTPGSRWIYGGWGQVNLATDFEDVDGDDFYFDIAAGGGYLLSDCFLLGAGVAGIDLGNDGYVMGGPGFYWKPTEELDVFLIGVLFNATWRPGDDWVLALRVRPFGNSWNVDYNGLSRQVDFRSYSARLHVDRRLFRDVWLTAGLGYSFANRYEFRTTSGLTLYHDHLDGGLSASLGLRVRTW